MIGYFLGWLRELRKSAAARRAAIDAAATGEIRAFSSELEDFPKRGRHRLPPTRGMTAVIPSVTTWTIPRITTDDQAPWPEAQPPEVGRQPAAIIDLRAGDANHGPSLSAVAATTPGPLPESMTQPVTFNDEPDAGPGPEQHPWPKGMTSSFKAVQDYVEHFPKYSRNAG